MDDLMDMLEQKLGALRGPEMPAAMEGRILRRIRPASLSRASRPYRQTLSSAMAIQIVILFALMTMAGWVLRSQVAPVFRLAWERAHCLVDPNVGGKDRR